MTSVNARAKAAAEPLRAALWFGLLAGAARALHHLVLRATADDIVWTGDFVFWAAPLGHVALFGLLGLLLSVVAFLAPRLVPTRLVMLIFAALAVFSLLLLFPRIHHLAALALALGVAVQTSRWLGTNPERRRVLTRSSAVIAACTVLAAIAVPVSHWIAERQAVNALPDAAANQPNVLLVVLDAARARSMSTYGFQLPTTPNITRLGADGVVFERAMATTSWTLPSSASLMTGQYPISLTTDWLRPLDSGVALLPEVLRTRGYLTGAFSANLHYFTTNTGLDRGVIRFKDYRVTIPEILLTVSLAQSTFARDLRTAVLQRSAPALWRTLLAFNWARPTGELAHDRKPAQIVAREFLDWQRSAGDRPWFAMLNFFDAHAPYKAQAPFDTMFGTSTSEKAYLGALATIDRELGRMFDELRRRGDFDRTIVVVTADHGELFGEHGWEHGNHLYLPLIHVPLVLRAPGKVPQGLRVRQTVSLRDVPATIVSLIDPTSDDEPSLGGQSLAATWRAAGAAAPSVALSVLSGTPTRDLDTPVPWKLFSVIDDSLHYLRAADGSELLFAYNADPDEVTTLTRDSAYASRLAAMRGRLDSVLKTEGVR